MLPTIRKRGYAPVYMSDFFNNDFDSFFKSPDTFNPAVNVREDEKSYSIELATPGMKRDEIKIEVEKDILSVSSAKTEEKSEEKNGYSRREFGVQTFCKNFTIPENTAIEKITASYKDGILSIEIPKSEKEAKVKKVIKIS